MADIFLSYASDDRERIAPLVAALERQGWSVWWDRSIPPGRNFDEVLEEEIRSSGFYRNKTKSLIGMGRVLVEDFDGEPPRTIAELTTLPGVARKTANVVLGTAFGIAEGVVVDTHVSRLSQRLGLSSSDKPTKIEQDLMAVLSQDEWVFAAHALILHGRRICVARRPRCDECELISLCPQNGVGARRSDGE